MSCSSTITSPAVDADRGIGCAGRQASPARGLSSRAAPPPAQRTSVHHTRELGQEARRRCSSLPGPRCSSIFGSISSAEMRLEPLVRALLIRAHQARVPRHVGGEDRGEAADRRHVCAQRSIVLTKATPEPAPALAFSEPERLGSRLGGRLAAPPVRPLIGQTEESHRGNQGCSRLHATTTAAVHIAVVLRQVGRVWGLRLAGYPLGALCERQDDEELGEPSEPVHRHLRVTVRPRRPIGGLRE